MQSVEEHDYSTLKWVKGEIDESLKAAKESLEAYLEDDDPGLILLCLDKLHEVQGTLRLLDIDGAAMLALEMEETAKALVEMSGSGDGDDDEEARETIIEALMGAMLRLPGYLEWVQDGHRDLPMALLPVFNDLRHSVGHAQLSEADLFNPSLDVTPPRTLEAVAEDPRSVARRLRPLFQSGLVAWLRGTDRDSALHKLEQVFVELGKACAMPEAARLWWVASGLVEALRDKGIEDPKQANPLFPKLDRQLKLTQDEGEAALSGEESTAIIRRILYLVGRSSSQGPRVEDLRSAFALERLLPEPNEIQEFEGSLTGATISLMDTVSDALREDLRTVMEPLDLFTRSRDRNVVELRSLAKKLDDIADTLAMLGVPTGRDSLRAQSRALLEMVTGEREVNNGSLSEIAQALLEVEERLGGIQNPDAQGQANQSESRVDSGKLRGSVMHEAKANLAAIKDQIIDYLAAGGQLSLHGSLKHLDEVRGSLVILGLERAADIVLHCENYLNGALQQGAQLPNKQQIESFAEAIAGLEYYLEAVDERIGGQKQILDSIERALAVLPEFSGLITPVYDHDEGDAAAVDEASEEADTESSDEGQTGFELDTLELDALEPVELEIPAVEGPAGTAEGIPGGPSPVDHEPETIASLIPAVEGDFADPGAPPVVAASTAEPTIERTSGAEPGGENAPAAPLQAPVQAATAAAEASSEVRATGQPKRYELPSVAIEQDADAELVEIFIEEATEEIDSINRSFPQWQQAPDDHEILANLRRSFHTLKGSGRMVGAWLVGEYAWAFENMLNGVLDRSVTPSPEMFQLVQAASAVLPTMIAQLQTGSEPDPNVEPYVAGAWALYDGQPLPPTTVAALGAGPVAAAEPTEEPAAVAPEAPPEPVPETAVEDAPDPVLMDIFQEEAAGHINAIREYVTEAQSQPTGRHEVSDDLLRALHTIHGSGRMAELNEIADLAGGLERFVKEVATSRQALSDDAIALLDDSAGALESAMASLDRKGGALPERHELLEQVSKLRQAFTAAGPMEQVRESAETHLQEVFLRDAADILQGAEETFKAWRADTDDPVLLADLVSDLETLSDGAKLAGNDALGELAGTEHGILGQVAEGALRLDESLAQLLGQAHDRLWTLLESGREGIAAPADQALMEQLAAAARGEAGPAPLEEPAAAEESVTAQEPAKTAEVAPITYEDAFPSDVDLDLLEAFLEEGEDLLGTTDSLIARLSNTPSDAKVVDELRRSMHTVKGGARMVGLMTMGHLSHALESMVQAVVDGHLPPSEGMFELLQRSHDTMATMLERARETKPLPKVDSLIGEVEGMLSLAQEGAAPVLETPPRREPVPELPEDVVRQPVSAPEPAPDRRAEPRVQQEQVRVRADHLNQLVNFAGEVSISRSRIEEQISGFRFNLKELEQTIVRLQQQLRNLELETEAQILFRHEQDIESAHGEFDPLEMDRYSTVQQLSRQLLESVSDFVSLHGLLMDQTREAETLLLQQSRVNTELQEGLIRTRMVPFSGLAPRLRRIVRQTAKELGKQVELRLDGASTEVDRTVLDRMVAPMEHLLRNSVNHGIEPPDDRRKAGKAATGVIRISLTREGQEVVIAIYDDGSGLNLSQIRRKAVERGLMKEGAPLSDKEVMHFILESGFTTASSVTQIAGRGVGMDVVNNEIKQLSGTLEINSLEGRSTTFTIRLPLTLSVNQALLVTVQDQNYAIPLSSIESVIQLSKTEADELYAAAAPRIERGDRSYQFVPLPLLLEQPVTPLQNEGDRLPVLLFSAGETNVAMSVDALVGVQEIVVKSVGAQLGRIREISGATILGDGRVVLIMDMASLLRKVVALHGTVAAADHLEPEAREERTGIRVMVVDDSITVRKITQRLLERNKMSVVTAKDGVDATSLLLEEEIIPDIIITDIEMPRMDGYELATLVRNDTRLSDIPIVMITSRTGAKHRDRAEAVGVNRYLGKPFQESDLLATIDSLVHAETP